jgi:1-phosphatidylinositol phosphodiesterase
MTGISLAAGCLLWAAVAVAQALEPASWMAAMPDDACLGSLTIPGTHNSAARHEPLSGTAKCQHLGITAQLEAGVRYLDVRCRHVDDGFLIHHGPVYQHITFEEVLAEVAAYLLARPGESVMVSIKPEHIAARNTRSFEDTFRAHHDANRAVWWVEPRLPALGEARGRMVLVRRFHSSGPLGIDASDWPLNATFSRGVIRVQDIYRIDDPAEKWRAFTAHAAASAEAPPGVLFLNHASGISPGLLGHPRITGTASALNARLDVFLAGRPSPRPRGVILGDFVTADRAAAIIRLNRPR